MNISGKSREVDHKAEVPSEVREDDAGIQIETGEAPHNQEGHDDSIQYSGHEASEADASQIPGAQSAMLSHSHDAVLQKHADSSSGGSRLIAQLDCVQ